MRRSRSGNSTWVGTSSNMLPRSFGVRVGARHETRPERVRLAGPVRAGAGSCASSGRGRRGGRVRGTTQRSSPPRGGDLGDRPTRGAGGGSDAVTRVSRLRLLRVAPGGQRGSGSGSGRIFGRGALPGSHRPRLAGRARVATYSVPSAPLEGGAVAVDGSRRWSALLGGARLVDRGPSPQGRGNRRAVQGGFAGARDFTSESPAAYTKPSSSLPSRQSILAAPPPERVPIAGAAPLVPRDP